MTAKTTWIIDPAHSEIAFKVKHLMISNVKGVFGEFNATAQTDGDDFSNASVQFSLSTASVNTGNADRDGHLKSPDFFDAETFPEITFTSDSMQAKGDDEYQLTGTLTIKGIGHKVSLDVEFGGLMKDPWGNVKAGFSLSGKINRKDWGLNWNAALETGGVLVGEEVKLMAEVELLRQSAS